MYSKLYLFILVLFALMACKEPNKELNGAKEIVKVETVLKKSTKSYVDLEGGPVELSDYKGKRVLLNFWATWCRSCIEEMPSLLRTEKLLEKDNYVFLLATDQSLKTIISFKERKGYDFKYIKYSGSFADLGIKALPKTFIYNEKGEKVEEISGAMEWDSPKILERLKAIK